jgi:hypothetical protein
MKICNGGRRIGYQEGDIMRETYALRELEVLRAYEVTFAEYFDCIAEIRSRKGVKYTGWDFKDCVDNVGDAAFGEEILK